MWRRPSPSCLSLSFSTSTPSPTSLLSFLCLFFISCLVLSTSPFAVSGEECVVSPTAWVLLRFNLRTGGDGALSSSSNIQIEVDNSTVALLQAVKTKLAVVSIIGPYRTGKSTLLNRLLPPNIPPSVFSVGHTVQPHTEEVSVYVIPPCALQGISLPPDTSLVFVDTPGLFAPNRVPLFDSQLLAVLNLISSVVVYNNVGVIKRVEVEQVHYTTLHYTTLHYSAHEQQLTPLTGKPYPTAPPLTSLLPVTGCVQLSDAVEAAFALSYYGDAESVERAHSDGAQE